KNRIIRYTRHDSILTNTPRRADFSSWSPLARSSRVARTPRRKAAHLDEGAPRRHAPPGSGGPVSPGVAGDERRDFTGRAEERKRFFSRLAMPNDPAAHRTRGRAGRHRVASAGAGRAGAGGAGRAAACRATSARADSAARRVSQRALLP